MDESLGIGTVEYRLESMEAIARTHGLNFSLLDWCIPGKARIIRQTGVRHIIACEAFVNLEYVVKVWPEIMY